MNNKFHAKFRYPLMSNFQHNFKSLKAKMLRLKRDVFNEKEIFKAWIISPNFGVTKYEYGSLPSFSAVKFSSM